MQVEAGPAPANCSPRATAVAHAWLREPIYRELESEALLRRDHVDAIAAKVITAVVILGLVDVLIERARKLLDC